LKKILNEVFLQMQKGTTVITKQKETWASRRHYPADKLVFSAGKLLYCKSMQAQRFIKPRVQK